MVFWNSDEQRGVVPFDGDDGVGVQGHQAIDLGELLRRLPVDGQDFVAGLEADAFSEFSGRDAVGGVVEREVGVPVGEEETGVDGPGEDEVHENAGAHDDEALPCGLTSEVVGPWWCGQLVGVEGFVDHSADFGVPSERKPADAVLSVADFPFPDGEPGVKEDVEFFYAYVEDLGGDEVSEFVYDDEDEEAQEELSSADEDSHELWVN